MDLSKREVRALEAYFLHLCGYRFVPDGNIRKLTRAEIDTLFLGYYLFKKHVDPQTANQDKKRTKSIDGIGGGGEVRSAKGSAKATPEFYEKFERFKTRVNAEKGGNSGNTGRNGRR